MRFFKEFENLTSIKLHEIDDMNWDNGFLTEGGKIVGLNLSKLKLTEIPKSINELTELKYLNLSFNQLESIPDSICKLNNLEDLNLENNNLKKLPKKIGFLKKLRRLNLWENPDLDRLPASIRQFEDLYSNFIELKIKYVGWSQFSRDTINLLKSVHRIKILEK